MLDSSLVRLGQAPSEDSLSEELFLGTMAVSPYVLEFSATFFEGFNVRSCLQARARCEHPECRTKHEEGMSVHLELLEGWHEKREMLMDVSGVSLDSLRSEGR